MNTRPFRVSVRRGPALSGGKKSSALAGAVRTIKAAILQSRCQAARLANAEMLKPYFAIGGYVSANSRVGTWGTGVIDAISERLSKELPGLRGSSPQNMRNMRQFFEEWTRNPNRQTLSGKLTSKRRTSAFEIRQPVADELVPNDSAESMSIGLLLCREMNKTMVGLTIRRHNSPMGVATYRTSEDVPEDYKTLRPLLDGARTILDEADVSEFTSTEKESTP